MCQISGIWLQSQSNAERERERERDSNIDVKKGNHCLQLDGTADEGKCPPRHEHPVVEGFARKLHLGDDETETLS